MDWSNPGLRTLASLPIAPGVHAHSIIPVETNPFDDADDGVVRYSSAHIEPVESELVIVPCGHSAQAHAAGDRGGPAHPLRARRDRLSAAYSSFFQVESGSKSFIDDAIFAVFGPRSFEKTSPSWFTRKVMIPEFPYSAGHATSAKPPIMRPRTT